MALPAPAWRVGPQLPGSSQHQAQLGRAQLLLRHAKGGAARRRAGSRPMSARAQQAADTAVDPGRITVGGAGRELEISRVVNGMWQTSSPAWGRAEADKIVPAMVAHLDAGLTTFDMADIYGPAEEYYGAMIDYLRRNRGEDVAARAQGLTKFCPSPGRMSRAVVEGNIDRSRKKMQVDTLDMVQMHWWDYGIPGYLDALQHLTDMREEGKIRTISLTNFDTKHLQIILEKGIPIASNQVQHSLVDMRPQQRMAELCSLTGVQLITYGTVLGGLLSEKFLDQREPNSMLGPRLTTPSQGKYKRMIDAWGGWPQFQKLLGACKTVGDRHGVGIAPVGIRYILDQPAVASSMVGVRFGLYQHVEASKKVFDLRLSEDDMAEIGAVVKQGRNLLESIGDCGDEYR